MRDELVVLLVDRLVGGVSTVVDEHVVREAVVLPEMENGIKRKQMVHIPIKY